MNKTELVRAIAKKANLRVSDTERMVITFIEIVSSELKKKGKVTLKDFGTFAVDHRKQKTGVNPKTGEKITIKAKKVPVFEAGGHLRSEIGTGPHRR